MNINNTLGVLFLSVNLMACSAIKNTQFPGSPGTTGLPASAVDFTDDFLATLLKKYPGYFDSLIAKKDEYHIQIIYTQINRDKKNNPLFTDHYFNISGKYFYPASTVKLPIAILALQKLNELHVDGLDMNTTMITEAAYDGETGVYNDPTTADGRPTIGHYIKKIFLTSDNDAANRLYEFLGQEYINNTLHKMGYEDAQIIHRLNISITEAQNRHTNQVKFFDAANKLIYEKPLQESKLVYAVRNDMAGKGYYKGSELITAPFDFSKKNRLALTDLHNILKSIYFPGQVSANHRFNLTQDDYNFLRKSMSTVPSESVYPTYDTAEYPEGYVKFLLCGGSKEKTGPGIRIFNKPGDAYGFLTDVAYIVDFKKKIEFMCSATIYCNADGILNDDKYDYDTIGLPFMKHLGQVIYDCELKRKHKYKPDLSSIVFNYDK